MGGATLASGTVHAGPSAEGERVDVVSSATGAGSASATVSTSAFVFGTGSPKSSVSAWRKSGAFSVLGSATSEAEPFVPRRGAACTTCWSGAARGGSSTIGATRVTGGGTADTMAAAGAAGGSVGRVHICRFCSWAAGTSRIGLFGAADLGNDVSG